MPYPAGGTTDADGTCPAGAAAEGAGPAGGDREQVGRLGRAGGARGGALGKPDGYTLLFINSGIVAVTPYVQKDAGFDGVKDFAPVALASMAPLFVVVRPTCR